MALGSVTVGTDTSPIYGTQAGASSYLNLSLEYASAWAAAAPTTTQRRALVHAYRRLSILPWRPGVVPEDVPAVVEASYELAGFLVVNPQGMGGPGGGNSSQGAVREVQDTTRRVAFYYSSAAQAARTSPQDALPRDVLAKIKQYLTRSGSSAGVPVVNGTDGVSEFTDDKKYTLTE